MLVIIGTFVKHVNGLECHINSILFDYKNCNVRIIHILLFYLHQFVRTDSLVKTVQGNALTPVLAVTTELVYATADVNHDGRATFVLKVHTFKNVLDCFT